MRIKIIGAAYGYRPDPARPWVVERREAGSIVEVSEAEAERLIARNAATYADKPTPKKPKASAGGGEK